MIFILYFFTFFAKAEVPTYWSHMIEIRDRHEFYQNNAVIEKPRDSWQTLFSVVYSDRTLNLSKDCVLYRVPGAELGELKIKTISVNEKCDEHLLLPGDKTWKEVKSLEFSVTDNKLTLDMTFPKYKNEKWELMAQSQFVKPSGKMHVSSAEMKGPKIIFLAPKQTRPSAPVATLANGSPCHEINDDCEEKAPATCGQCSDGWYEIPNGCKQGPKFCGTVQCGEKNGPACRRGMKWQRTESDFDCRMDSSFAYCSKGLAVQCEGKLAYCR